MADVQAMGIKIPATEVDATLARRVYDAIHTLNIQITAAEVAGLKVEVSVDDRQVVGTFRQGVIATTWVRCAVSRVLIP